MKKKWRMKSGKRYQFKKFIKVKKKIAIKKMVIKYDSKKNLKDEIIKKSQFYKLFEIKINSNLKNMNQSDK
jgi:hypothetical protein